MARRPPPASPPVAQMPPRPTGRPPKLTPDLIERVAKLIRGGCYLETAAGSEGIPRETLHRWLAKGREGRGGLYGTFRHAVEKALADAETRDIARIDTAATKFWQAAAWKLERRNPRRWSAAQRVRFEVERQIKLMLDVLAGRLDEPTFRRVLEAMRELPADDDTPE